MRVLLDYIPSSGDQPRGVHASMSKRMFCICQLSFHSKVQPTVAAKQAVANVLRTLFLLVLLAPAAVVYAEAPGTSAGQVQPPESLLSAVQFGRPSAFGNSDYGEAHTDFLCLKPKTNCVTSSYSPIRSDLTCCEQPDRGRDMDLGDALFTPDVGRCVLQSSINYGSINSKGLLLGADASILTCTLSEDADICGLEGCGELTLTAVLATYAYYYAVITGDPSTIPSRFDDELFPFCSGAARRTNTTKEDLASKFMTGPVLDALKHTAANDQHRAPTNTGLSLGANTVVLSGPVTVTSKTGNPKWRQGWFDFKLPLYVQENVSPEDVAALDQKYGALPRFDASTLNKYNFRLFNHKELY